LLPYTWMGIACLAVLWTAALLCAGAAWQELRDLRSLSRSFESLQVGTVLRGDGDGGCLAFHEIEQTGRALDGEPAIAFHDRSHRSAVCGGVVKVGDEEITVDGDREVWTKLDDRARLARCNDLAHFDEAYESARKAKGWRRTVRTELREGDRVFLAAGVISSEDPRPFVASRTWLVLSFIAGELSVCALCTRVATWPPVFGTVSTVGGVMCLAFFLLVTPMGVRVRDACRPPSRAFLRGTWKRAKMAS